jgi:hypothetical protein
MNFDVLLEKVNLMYEPKVLGLRLIAMSKPMLQLYMYPEMLLHHVFTRNNALLPHVNNGDTWGYALLREAFCDTTRYLKLRRISRNLSKICT